MLPEITPYPDLHTPGLHYIHVFLCNNITAIYHITLKPQPLDSPFMKRGGKPDEMI
jgi:hypothetical protein